MRFEGKLDIDAPRDRVWSFLTDPAQVTTCAPDVQSLEVTDPHHFKVVVRAGVGPIKGTFTMNVQFLELERPKHAAVPARGQAPGGFSCSTEGSATAKLSWNRSSRHSESAFGSWPSTVAAMDGRPTRTPHSTTTTWPPRASPRSRSSSAIPHTSSAGAMAATSR